MYDYDYNFVRKPAKFVEQSLAPYDEYEPFEPEILVRASSG